MMQTLRRSFFGSLLAVFMTATALAGPGGVYNSNAPTPTYKSDAPPPREAKHAVAPDGAAEYSVPFQVPPGRNGAQPTVALSYSSRSPVRGGIAAGWTLPIPMISVDTSSGRLAKKRYEVNGRRLIAVIDAEPGGDWRRFDQGGANEYRAEGDLTYTRYEHRWDGTEEGHWVALHLDGSVTEFGKTWDARDRRVDGSMSSPLYGHEARWFVSKTRDANGNLVEYTYDTVRGNARNGAIVDAPVDIALRRIEYGRNANVPSSQHHAKIELAWQANLSTCPGSSVPIGAQFTYRTGIRLYEGARKLDWIDSSVRDAAPGSQWRTRRRMFLDYNAETERCDRPHAPFRQLAAIREYAYGVEGAGYTRDVVTLPPITFTYGPLDYSYPAQATGSEAFGLSRMKDMLSADKPGGWPSLDFLVEDLDGNGVPEWHWGEDCTSFPQMPWADGTSPHPKTGPTPLHDWEGCSLAGQITHRLTPRTGNLGQWPGSGPEWRRPFNFYGYRFLDVNGDGKQDLIAALDYEKSGYRPTEDPAVGADYPACSSLPVPPCSDPDGDRVACLFAAKAQMVHPIDNSFGSSGNPADVYGPGVWTSYVPYLDDPWGPPGPSPTPGTQYKVPLCPWCPAYIRSTMAGDLVTYFYAGTPEQAQPSDDQSTGFGNVPDLHCGYYLYRVHINQSTGTSLELDPTPSLVRSPVPIDSMGLATSFGPGTANASHWRAIVDLDGDQRPDAYYMRPSYLRVLDTNGDGCQGCIGDEQDIAPAPASVWLGSSSGTGAFTGQAWLNSPYPWNVPHGLVDPSGHSERQRLMETVTWGEPGDVSQYGLQHESETSGLHDINGDGLLDLVRSENGLRVFYNTGAGFEAGPGTLLEDGTTLPAMSRSRHWKDWGTYWGTFTSLEMSSHRPADVDGDGLIDVVEINVHDTNIAAINPLVPPYLPGTVTPGAVVTAHISTGDRFIPVNASATLGGFRTAFSKLTIGGNSEYRTMGDFVDVNGDGLADVVQPGRSLQNLAECSPDNSQDPLQYGVECAQHSEVFHASPAPLRLLEAVDNGLGGRLELDYAPIRDTSVVSRDAAHEATQPDWVVKATRVINGSLTASTDYRYVNPVYDYDRFDRFGFRGFEQVVETGPAVLSGARARTYTSYRYDLAPAGLVSRTLAVHVLANGAEKLLSVTETGYSNTPLFDGPVTINNDGVVNAYQAENWIASTCATPVNGTSDASVQTCLAGAGISHTVHEWTPLSAWNIPVAYAVTSERRMPTRADSTADVRHTETAHELRYDPSFTEERYQLLETDETTHDSAGVQLARRHRIHDSRGNVLEESIYIDDTNASTTSRSYDVWGNVRVVIRPNQQAELMPLESNIDYDGHQIHSQVVTNELGHQTVTVRDLATGVVIETQGPSEDGQRLVHRMRIDGLGRPLETRRGLVAHGFTDADLTLIGTAAYVDMGTRTVTVDELLKETPPRWITTTTTFDALGNIVREDRPGAGGLHVTSYIYDAGGHLIQVTVPSPTGSGTVGYRWAYDGRGREVKRVFPSNVEAPIETVYDGLTTTTFQRATDGPSRLHKEIDRDGFGRIIAVTEGHANPVSTAYDHDELDRLVGVVDADGIETTIDYDQRGLRTAITRGQTTIAYVYDRGGNRTETHDPTGTTPFDPAKDVSRWTYDAIDRLTTSTPAARDWEAVDYRRYGPDGVSTPASTIYTYDQSDHGFGAGRLTRVQTPVLTTDLHYSAEGRVEKETRSWSVAPDGNVWSGTAEQLMTHGPSGLLLTVRSPDGETLASYDYDDRGRPSRVDLSGGSVSTFATFTRNLAGYVTVRGTATPGVHQSWTRDAMARVTASEIRGTWGCAPSAGCPIDLIAGETAVFNSLGNVVSSVERGQNIALGYTYDERDQLATAASADGTSYYGAFTYSGGGRLLAATVSTGLPSSHVVTRNAVYDYTPQDVNDTADPAAVRSLRDVLTSDEIARFVYDPSGNLIQRGDHTFIYDGSNKLREAVDETTGCFEIYYYDHAGGRALTYRGACGDTASVRHRFGTTEIFHRIDGSTTSTADVPLGDSAVLRVTREAGAASVEQLFHGVLGSLLATTDGAGQGTSRHGYGPYGEILYTEGPNATRFDHLYNGKAYDALTRLSYYGARYYDSLTLSWTQADPYYRFRPDAALTDPRRMALYTFNLNNPIRYVDPDGLDPLAKVVDGMFTRLDKFAKGYGVLKMVSAFWEDDEVKATGRFFNGMLEMTPVKWVSVPIGIYDALDSDSDEHTGEAVIAAAGWVLRVTGADQADRSGPAFVARFNCNVFSGAGREKCREAKAESAARSARLKEVVEYSHYSKGVDQAEQVCRAEENACHAPEPEPEGEEERVDDESQPQVQEPPPSDYHDPFAEKSKGPFYRILH